jgi:hypothetical protein
VTATGGVHLVGSVPLTDAHAVFTAVATHLSGRVKRIPDGETGERSGWTSWQWHAFHANPSLEPTSGPIDGHYESAQFRVRGDMRTEEVRFGELGYAAVAIDSYGSFARLKAQGIIPPDVRFQVSIPTPIAIIARFADANDRAIIESAYESALIVEIGRMAAVIPYDQLAVQWDVAVEVAFWEWENGRRDFRYRTPEGWFPNVKDGIISRLARLAEAVPAGAELGVHLCYGNRDGHHFVEPVDTSTAVEMANALFTRLRRRLHWLHLPVPKDRADAAYFTPLRALKLPPDTELYLGLVHDEDGADGTARRIEQAQAVVESFGVSTECGFGRRPPATIPALLDLHHGVTKPPTLRKS